MNLPFRHCHLIGVLFLALGPGLLGCGPSRAIVQGKVTYRNKPLSSGEVHFIGANGATRSALIGPAGNFELADAPLGEVKVAVVAYESPGKLKGPSAARKTENDPGEIVPRTSAIPSKYNDVTTSELVFTISLGTQMLVIDLKD